MDQIRIQRIQTSLIVDVPLTKSEKDQLKVKIKSLIKDAVKSKNIEVYTTYEEKEKTYDNK